MSRWMRTWTRWTRSARVSPYREPLELPALADADEQPVGCGWFDSSWELRRGLAVIEGPALDPLGKWCQAQFSYREGAV